ncbi:hypothetical protein P9112_013277 [Eukaryota sp. TZLM1-RC]
MLFIVAKDKNGLPSFQLPGGSIENNETPYSAATWEYLEETGNEYPTCETKPFHFVFNNAAAACVKMYYGFMGHTTFKYRNHPDGYDSSDCQFVKVDRVKDFIYGRTSTIIQLTHTK